MGRDRGKVRRRSTKSQDPKVKGELHLLDDGTTVVHLKTTDVKFIREELLADQGGQCWICHRRPERPCLDHDHRKKLGGTGLVRGVLCHTCNSLLAKVENHARRFRVSREQLPHVLEMMAVYIIPPFPPYLHPSERPKPPRLTKRSYRKLATRYERRPNRMTFPPYAGRLTKKLQRLFALYNIEPEFYR